MKQRRSFSPDFKVSAASLVLDQGYTANGKWGRGTMDIGSGGVKDQHDWAMLRGNLSPAYTTRWNALRRVVD